MSDSIVEITSKEQFSTIIEENDTILADFKADWCGPCKMMEPIVEDFSEKLDVQVVSVDIDDNNDIASEYQVRAVPTFIIFSEDEVKEQLTGVQQENELRELVEKYM